MIITSVTARKVETPLKNPLTVALGTIYTSETVYLKLETDCGLVGYGEGIGVTFVTGETSDQTLNALKLFEPIILGKNPHAISQIHREMDMLLVGNGAAKAAVDIALYDLMAKAAGLPLYRFLGGSSNQIETDITIGISSPEKMAEMAAQYVTDGFRELKIKAGTNPDLDVEALRLIRQAAPTARLKVDANQGYTVATSMRVIRACEKFEIEAMEQPLPFWDIAGLQELRTRTDLPIIADESCFTPQDAFKIAKTGAADILNIKLMKCGGLYRANQISTIAESAGLRCMLGCMMESRLSIAAAAAFVAANKCVIYADLDSFLALDDSSVIKSSFNLEAPTITLQETPGLGVEVNI